MSDSVDSNDNVRMLTTRDNPYDPFTQYDEWYAYDTKNGYNTCAYLARVAKDSDELSEKQESDAIQEAIAEILFFNVTGNYIAITKDYFSKKH